VAIESIDDPVAEVVFLRDRLAVAEGALAEVAPLTERLNRLIASITGPAPLNEVRQALNEVGIQQARQRLEVDTIDACEHALLVLRQKQDAERLAREARDQALTEAVWTLEATHFTSRSNKTYLVANVGDGTPIPEADQRSFDASARKDWLDFHAGKTDAVRMAVVALRHAEEDTRSAQDAVAIAEKRFSAAKHSVDAAAAQLTALQRCLPREG
jgi:hypothetical protein